ncbi:DUF2790 domain-containing protein [Pseudomonas sp. LS-2]|jgi:hypothetical protein|uniref:DUF2790 domain-containing protein n=1 Tax=Pseudomonas sp. LS-2 TaxID=2315859 RepID=UPI000E7105E3|nr:DUF2790 domain-containing protein [Pseudomonas sp. LS-2]RJX78903.1 DUF2790 domain-containing protein [Pseudomonas sp. LS-2]
MKYALFAALTMFSALASANGNVSPVSDSTPAPVEYNYSQHLDIAKVISVTSANDAATECGPVEAHMVYVDSKGVTHNLEYTRLGDGCQNG